jgi:hypothetical protein
MSDNHYDVIIIGTGAGGGTLASYLARSASASWSLSAAITFPVRKQIGILKSLTLMPTTTRKSRGSTSMTGLPSVELCEDGRVGMGLRPVRRAQQSL